MHKIYLVLRNNQQSGPYNLQELQQLPLSAHDLIWVEGQSASWRYPAEIEALRSFVQEKESHKAATPKETTAPNGTTTAPGKTTTPRHIYVSLPAQPATPVADTAKASEAELLEKKAQELFQRVQAYNQAHAAPAETEELEHPKPRTMEEMQRDYAAWLRQQKKRQQRSHFQKHFLTAAVVVLLLLSGAAFTWWMMRQKPINTLQNGAETTLNEPAPMDEHGRQPEALNNFISNTEPYILPQKEGQPDPLDKTQTTEKKPTALSSQKTNGTPLTSLTAKHKAGQSGPAARDSAIRADSAAALQPKAETTPAPTPARQEEKSEERVDKRRVPLSTLVQLEGKPFYTENQKRLTGLTLFLHNNSTEILKNVTVNILYYKKGEKLLDTKTIYFKEVQPQSSASFSTLADNRSVAARYQIASIVREDGSLYLMK